VKHETIPIWARTFRRGALERFRGTRGAFIIRDGSIEDLDAGTPTRRNERGQIELWKVRTHEKWEWHYTFRPQEYEIRGSGPYPE
jgi:hypothetical protein